MYIVLVCIVLCVFINILEKFLLYVRHYIPITKKIYLNSIWGRLQLLYNFFRNGALIKTSQQNEHLVYIQIYFHTYVYTYMHSNIYTYIDVQLHVDIPNVNLSDCVCTNAWLPLYRFCCMSCCVHPLKFSRVTHLNQRIHCAYSPTA